jgi:hypothetical protein
LIECVRVQLGDTELAGLLARSEGNIGSQRKLAEYLR